MTDKLQKAPNPITPEALASIEQRWSAALQAVGLMA